MFANLKWFLIVPKISRKTITQHRFFRIKAHHFDNCSSESGKLSTRLFKYIGQERAKLDVPKPYTIEYRQFYPISDCAVFQKKVEQCPANELAKVVIYFDAWKSNNENNNELVDAMNLLDKVCANRTLKLNRVDLLNLLYAFLYVIPDQITKLQFYPLAIRRLTDTYESSLSKYHFVHTCFYIGLWKKNSESTKLLEKLVNRHFNKYLDKVNTMDLVIIAIAAYRTSMKMNVAHVRRFEQEFLQLEPKDEAMLNAFIKIIRMNRLRSLKVAERLQHWIVSGYLDNFQFLSFAHIFMFFMDNLFKDTKAIECLTKKCLHQIQEEYVKYQAKDDIRDLPNDMRAKDFAMFLWCLAQLNVKAELQEVNLDKTVDIILEKVHAGEYNRDFDCLVETCLSLWMLNYKSKKLVWHVFHNKSITRPTEGRQRIKMDSRKYLLLSCIEIEKPDWLKEFGIPLRTAFNADYPAKEFLIERAPNLQKVFDIITLEEWAADKVKLVKPIRDLNIPGILIQLNEIYFIEVFEMTTVLSDGNTPFGMLELKLGLLKACGCNVKTVSKFGYCSPRVISLKIVIDILLFFF